MFQDTEENNLLLWGPCHNDNKDTLGSAATALSLFSYSDNSQQSTT